VDLAAIARTVSAIGTVLLAALFGYQVTVFKKQVEVNRGTLDEMREGRTAHELPRDLPARGRARRTPAAGSRAACVLHPSGSAGQYRQGGCCLHPAPGEWRGYASA